MMATVPWGIQQLMESSQVRVRPESAWLKRIYSVTSQEKELLRIKSSGIKTFKVKVAKDHKVAVLHYSHKLFKSPVMEVRFGGLPVITVKPKGGMSQSLLVVDETEQQVLKVRPHNGFSWGKKDYKILGAGDLEVGNIRRGFRKSDFCFPSDLDVRYKVALIAAVIYEDILEASRSS